VVISLVTKLTQSVVKPIKRTHPVKILRYEPTNSYLKYFIKVINLILDPVKAVCERSVENTL